MTKRDAAKGVVRKWSSFDRKNRAYVDSAGYLHVTVKSIYLRDIGIISLTLDPPKANRRTK